MTDYEQQFKSLKKELEDYVYSTTELNIENSKLLVNELMCIMQEYDQQIIMDFIESR